MPCGRWMIPPAAAPLSSAPRPTLTFVSLPRFHQVAARCVPFPGVRRGGIAWSALSDFRHEWRGHIVHPQGGTPYCPSLPSASILPLGLLRSPHMLRYPCSSALPQCILGLYQDHAYSCRLWGKRSVPVIHTPSPLFLLFLQIFENVGSLGHQRITRIVKHS